MQRKNKAAALLLLLLLTLVTVSACGNGAASEVTDLTAEITPLTAGGGELSGPEIAALADFSVKLFQNSMSAETNSLISPLAVLHSLGMTMNGAAGETLAQMEGMLGLSGAEMRNYAQQYAGGQLSGDRFSLNLANAVWFKDDETLSLNTDFLTDAVSYYQGGAYSSAFDKGAAAAINSWLGGKTGGAIAKAIESTPDYAGMYLVSALALDAEWEQPYTKTDLLGGSFFVGPGHRNQTEMMYSEEDLYLTDDNAVGFIKNYAGGRYAFAALLPDEGVSAPDYVAALSGEKLLSILNNAEQTKVSVAIPKFKGEYAHDMRQALIAMGMSDAFEQGQADFSRLGSANAGALSIGGLLNATYFMADELGARAGAESGGDSLEKLRQEKKVVLERPFVYMVIDRETNLPLLIGAALEAGKTDTGM